MHRRVPSGDYFRFKKVHIVSDTFRTFYVGVTGWRSRGRQRARKKERELYLIALSGIFRVFDHRFIDKKVFRFTDNVDIVYMKIFAKFQKFLRSPENMNFEGANSYLVIKSTQRVVEEGKFGKNWESGGIVFPNAVIFLRVQT